MKPKVLGWLVAAILFSAPLMAQQWTARYSSAGANIDEAAGMVARSGETFLAGSVFTAGGNWDIVTIRLKTNGDTSWVRRFDMGGDEKASSILIDAAGNIYIAGYGWTDTSRWQGVLLKYDANGGLLWTTTFSSAARSANIPVGAALLSNGNVVYAIQTETSDSKRNTHVVALTPNGRIAWQDMYPNSIPSALSSSTAGVAVVGAALKQGETDGFALLYNNSGTRISDKQFDAGSNKPEVFTRCVVDPTGYFYAAGWHETDAQNSSILVVKYKSSGEFDWSYIHPSPQAGLNRATGIAVDPTGNAIVAGRQTEAAGGYDYLTVQIKPDGTLRWARDLAGPGIESDNSPPIFAGVTAGYSPSPTSIVIDWAAARDDQSMFDEIEYEVFLSTTSGGQNYNTPDYKVKGKTSLTIPGLQENTDYFVVVRAKDVLGNSDKNTRERKVSTQSFPLVITTKNLPDGTVGAAYNASLDASGGSMPYSWDIVSGSLPEGLLLDTDGTISGTPAKEGVFSFTARVTDAVSDTASTNLSITVLKAPLTIITQALLQAYPGQPYTDSLKATGGTVPYQWSLTAGELPPGLSLTAGGVVRDTALDDGVYQFTVQVRDAVGDSASKNLSLDVVRPPALHVKTDTTISGGKFWYSTVVVDPGATLTFSGDATLCATDSVTITGTVRSNCYRLELRTTESFYAHGLISNECSVTPGNPPRLKIVADGYLELGKTVGPLPVIVSHGPIDITDSYTEHADLTPISIVEFKGGNDKSILSKSTPSPAVQPRGGGANVNRPPRAGSGQDNRTFRDGNVSVNNGMSGGNGNDAVGANVIGGAGGAVSLGSRNGTLNIAAGVTIQAGDGGKGQSVTATGCPAVADASGGKGGRGGSVMLGGQSITFGAGVTLNRGNGGDGGDATATGDPAAGDCADGCTAIAIAGPGGAAGGIGYMLVNPGTINGAPTEGGGNGGNGGTGTATASNGNDCSKCPAGNGGKGGTGSATGGDGGDGATGNIWTIAAGSHKSGNGGNATATGGNGGNGATCCTPPMQGGNGGNGGDALALAGDAGKKGMNKGTDGTYNATAGNGGNGGDGKPPGSKGTRGTASVKGVPGTKTDGQDGADGQLCVIIEVWWIYFSTLQDGIISAGTVRVQPAYLQQNTQSQAGTVEMHFLTQQEYNNLPVDYRKAGDDVIINSGGMLLHMNATHDTRDTSRKWLNTGVQFDFRSELPTAVGYCYMVGMKGGLPIAEKEVIIDPVMGPIFHGKVDAPQGEHFESVVIIASVPIRFNHWWLGGVFIDP